MEQRIAGLRKGMETAKWLHEMPKPTLAVMPGPAAGAGLSLALACDMRICTTTAKLTTAFSKIGASGDYGGSYFPADPGRDCEKLCLAAPPAPLGLDARTGPAALERELVTG